MIEIFKELQQVINGPEAETAREWYFGKFFTGDFTITLEGKNYTMSFYKGEMIDVYEGLPYAGVNVGLSATMDRWKDFFNHGIFGFATAPAYQNPLGLTVTGNIITFRQNYSLFAHVCKQFAKLCNERGIE